MKVAGSVPVQVDPRMTPAWRVNVCVDSLVGRASFWCVVDFNKNISINLLSIHQIKDTLRILKNYEPRNMLEAPPKRPPTQKSTPCNLPTPRFFPRFSVVTGCVCVCVLLNTGIRNPC